MKIPIVPESVVNGLLLLNQLQGLPIIDDWQTSFLNSLTDNRDALTSADAGRRQSITTAPALEFM